MRIPTDKPTVCFQPGLFTMALLGWIIFLGLSPENSLWAQMKTGRGMRHFNAAFRLDKQRALSDVAVTLIQSNAPGCIYFPGEAPAMTFQFKNRTNKPIQAAGRVDLIQFAVRSIPNDIWQSDVMRLRACGSVPLQLQLAPRGWQNVTVKPVLPPGKGGYGLVADLGALGRDFLCGLVRTFKPITERIQCPKQALDNIRPSVLERLGIQAIRKGWGYVHTKEPSYVDNMKRLDGEMADLHRHKVTVVLEFGAGRYDRPIPPNPRTHLTEEGQLKGGKGDMCWMPGDDGDFEHFVYRILCRHGWPKGPITGVMLWNEPWEGISISGWGADMLRYRAIYRHMGRAVDRACRDAGVDVLIGGCDSSTNTWDKLFPDGKDTFMPWFDFCSIHYQGMSAPVLHPEWRNRRHKKGRVLIWDTESWVANTDDRVAGVVATNRAAGYDRALGIYFGNICTQLSHNRTVVDTINSTQGPVKNVRPLFSWPVAASVGAVQHFIGERPFHEILFKAGLPWVYVFEGRKSQADDGTIVVVGDIGTLFTRPDQMLFRTVKPITENPVMLVDDKAGLFRLYDFYGNPVPARDDRIAVPLDARGFFLRARPGKPGAFTRLVDAVSRAEIIGFEPVEIIARDMTRPLADKPVLTLRLHNVLNRPVKGSLAVTLGNLILAYPRRHQLDAHATKIITVKVTGGQARMDNRYPLSVCFEAGPDGMAEHEEIMHVNVIAKRRITVDGRLSDWSGVLPHIVQAEGKATQTLTEKAWLPFVPFDPGETGGLACVYLAYDRTFFYVGVKISDASRDPGTLRFETRQDDAFFYPAACFTVRSGKKETHTWPEGVRRYSYRRNPVLPDGRASRFDNVQIAFNAVARGEDGWLSHLPGRMPGFTVYKCTDYEYALNKVAPAHGGGFEIWRLLVPGMSRKHFYPRQPAHPLEGPVKNGQLITVYVDNTRLTEAAIPWSEIPHVKACLDAGRNVKFSLAVNNNTGGPILELAKGRSVSKINAMAFHPDWSEHWANEVSFGFEQ